MGLVERLCFDYLDLLGAQQYDRLTFTGGAARSGYWSRLRADILGRSVYIPQYSEPALGMAILAAYGAGTGTSLIRTAGAMVRLRHVLHPHPVRTAWYTESYLTLVDELERRGWLPGPVAAHARTRTEKP